MPQSLVITCFETFLNSGAEIISGVGEIVVNVNFLPRAGAQASSDEIPFELNRDNFN
jgi:hypothetical protein